MPIAVSSDHEDLAASLREWARDRGGPAVARAAEAGDPAAIAKLWPEILDQGIALIAVAEEYDGGGGDVLDLAVALEACAHGLIPGPLLGTATAATLMSRAGAAGPLETIAAGTPCAVALEASLVVGERITGDALVYDAGGSCLALVGAAGGKGGPERWFVVPVETPDPGDALDLGRVVASVEIDVAASDAQEIPGLSGAVVRRLLLTLAAAEASGLASWCLSTAVEYAKVREQFGQPIGRFQAIKHLCAGMLEATEAVSASAWDAASAAGAAMRSPDPEDGTAGQWGYAADVAGAVALDGAVRVAQDCIQVLGGIGFTFEHDAHLALRRATSLRALLGRGDRHAAALARRAVAGERRRLQVDLSGHADLRERIRGEVAGIAALPQDERRAALVDSGLLVPHWPSPYGRDASAVEQLVIDEELTAAGIARPDLKIAGWAVPTILAHGSEEQRERFVRPTLLGELTWCQLFSEPGAGSDLASLTTRAERTELGWRLQGQKVWTSLARESDWAICLARTNPDAPRHRGITYFLVDMTTPGIEIRPLREMTGDAMFNEVFLDGVVVPDECVVGAVDGGWALARTTLANERVAMASARLGASVERAVELISPGEQGQHGEHGGPDVTDLARVGQQVALSTVCGLLGARVILRTLAGAGPGPESSVAKLLGVRSRQEASELVVDLLGPRALLGARGGPDVREDVHEMLLTRCLSIAGGTTQVLRNVAAEQILGLPR